MVTEISGKLLLKIPEACQATGYSKSFLYEQIAAGALRAIRVGRTIRISADDLRDWIARQREVGDE